MAERLVRDEEGVATVNGYLEHFGIGYELRVERLTGLDDDRSEVFALRLKDVRNGVSTSLRDVGYGISQILGVNPKKRTSPKVTFSDTAVELPPAGGVRDGTRTDFHSRGQA